MKENEILDDFIHSKDPNPFLRKSFASTLISVSCAISAFLVLVLTPINIGPKNGFYDYLLVLLMASTVLLAMLSGVFLGLSFQKKEERNWKSALVVLNGMFWLYLLVDFCHVFIYDS